MKKALLTFLFSLALTAMMHAQTGLHLGFHGQYNSIWIINQDNYAFSQMDYEYKFGPSGGVSVGYNWLDNYGAQIEFNYAFMGQYYKDIVRDFSQSYNPDNTQQLYPVETYRDVNLTYLQIPILFKYMEGDKKDAIKYHMEAGLQIGVLLGADQNYTADVYDNGQQVEIAQAVAPQSGVPAFVAAGGIVPIENYYKKLDIGGLIDIGVDIYVNDKIYFTPALRLHYGFLDMNAEDTRNITPAKGENIYRGSHNAFAGFNLGINFMLPEFTKSGGGGSTDD